MDHLLYIYKIKKKIQTRLSKANILNIILVQFKPENNSKKFNQEAKKKTASILNGIYDAFFELLNKPFAFLQVKLFYFLCLLYSLINYASSIYT
jgi:hypothetical protein